MNDSVELQKPLEFSRRELHAMIADEHSGYPEGSKEFTTRMDGGARGDVAEDPHFRPLGVGIHKHDKVRAQLMNGLAKSTCTLSNDSFGSSQQCRGTFTGSGRVI